MLPSFWIKPQVYFWLWGDDEFDEENWLYHASCIFPFFYWRPMIMLGSSSSIARLKYIHCYVSTLWSLHCPFWSSMIGSWGMVLQLWVTNNCIWLILYFDKDCKEGKYFEYCVMCMMTWLNVSSLWIYIWREISP